MPRMIEGKGRTYRDIGLGKWADGVSFLFYAEEYPFSNYGCGRATAIAEAVAHYELEYGEYEQSGLAERPTDEQLAVWFQTTHLSEQLQAYGIDSGRPYKNLEGVPRPEDAMEVEDSDMEDG